MTKKDKRELNDYMLGDIETHTDAAGNLILEYLGGPLDWQRLATMPEIDALAELLEYQTANGYEWIQPEEISALTDAPILGRDVTRDDSGNYQSAAAIYWFSDYQVLSAIDELRRRHPVTFYRA